MNPLYCEIFAAAAICLTSLLLWSIRGPDFDVYQCSVCFDICDLNLNVNKEFHANKNAACRFPLWCILFNSSEERSENIQRTFWSSEKLPSSGEVMIDISWRLCGLVISALASR